MACMSGFYKRLKEIFSLSGDNKSSGACGCANETSCCIGMPHASGNGSNVEALTVNVNPYAPIEEIKLKVACLDGKNERRGKGTMGRFKGSRICKVLRFKSCSKESSAEHEFEASAPTVSRSGSTELYNLEKSSTTVSSCDNRYKRDFQELDLVGAGEFGSVYRCVHRLDGRVYAVKRSRALDKGNYWRRRAINEVHANAVLNNHPNVVRYYGAWLEDERMSIQQEFCVGGDLSKLILGMRRDESFFEEEELCRILVHVATGLRYIHGSQLAHMDIKPENIFISREQIWTTKEERDDLVKDEGCCRDEIVYKIGDLGHVTGIADTAELEDEGDCRYLSKEVLREDYTDLAKADVFALGLTVYEAGGGGPLPKNGPAWHEIREGKLRRLMRYSEELNHLLMAMIHLNPQRRPSAHDIVQQNFYSIRQYSK